MLKTCNKCEVEQDISKFNKSGLNQNKEQIYRSTCRTCGKPQRSEQYIKDRKELQRSRAKQHYELNKELYKQRATEWVKSNPKRRREIVAKNRRKRRAMKIDINENYTTKDELFTRNLFNHKCYNCESTDKLCIDHHRALSKGNALTIFNAVLLCISCNSSKQAKAPEEFYGLVKCEALDKKIFIAQVAYALRGLLLKSI